MIGEEVEKLRHGVIPIIGSNKRRRPYVVGSGVLLMYRDRKVLVTANHVLSDNEDVPLFTFANDHRSRPFGGIFGIEEEADLAAKFLSPDEENAFSHLAFIRPADFGRVAVAGEQFYAGVTGYPSTLSKPMDRITIDTRMSSYGGMAEELSSGGIEVVFDKKEGMTAGGEHVKPHDPYGMSGGAIFGIELHGSAILPGRHAKLVGIATDWVRSKKVIQGPSFQVIAKLLDEMISEIAF